MPSAWIEHVKKVHAAGSTSYKESLKRASKTWKKGSKKSEDPAPQEQAEPKKKRARKRKKAAPKIPK